MFTIEIEIDKKDLAALKKMPEKVKPAITKGMRNAMFLVEREAKLNMGKAGKPQVRTGHLRRSIKSDVYNKGNDVVGAVGSNLVYAPVQELGAIIKAKTGDYLRFKINNQFVSVKQVVIPPRPYLAPAVSENEESIRKIIAREIVNSLNEG